MLPFAAGLYLSYLFRTINALISNQLALGAADLGLLTSVYFLTFAVAQLPVGILLDRYGPRRVQSALLVIAAAGAALFGASREFPALVVARALIGLGMAASFAAALKAVVLWFAKERVALLNGCVLMLGALGAVTATIPAERLLASIGWQQLFELLAAVTAVCAVVTFLVVPDSAIARRVSPANLSTVYCDPRFWRLAPLSGTCVGTAWSLQSLWAASWLTDVEGVKRTELIQYLFIMAAALSVGALVLGVAVNQLRQRGIRPQSLLTSVATLLIASQLALIFRWPIPSGLLWSVIAMVGAGTVLSYSVQAEYVPKELAGRANAALNVFHIGGAFVLQFLTGLIVQQWTNLDGHYPAIAYQTALAFNVGLQIAALLWFESQWVRELWTALAPTIVRALADVRQPTDVYSYNAPWVGRRNPAPTTALNWRLAALASAIVLVLLALSITS